MGLAQYLRGRWNARRTAPGGGTGALDSLGGMGANTVGKAPGALDFPPQEELWQGFGQEQMEPVPQPFSFEEELERQALRYRQDMEELW